MSVNELESSEGKGEVVERSGPDEGASVGEILPSSGVGSRERSDEGASVGSIERSNEGES